MTEFGHDVQASKGRDIAEVRAKATAPWAAVTPLPHLRCESLAALGRCFHRGGPPAAAERSNNGRGYPQHRLGAAVRPPSATPTPAGARVCLRADNAPPRPPGSGARRHASFRPRWGPAVLG